MLMPFTQFLHAATTTAENSGKTAGCFAVFPSAAPSAAQQFRGNHDIAR
jgi:hypothetical protein